MLGTARLAGIMAAKTHARADPALPSAAAHARSRSTCALDDALPGVRVTRRASKVARPDRRRDGGADRRLASPASPIYDMVKAVDRGMRIEGVRLLEKSGGNSGDWRGRGVSRHEPAAPGRGGARAASGERARPLEAETVPLAARARPHARRATSRRCARSRPSPPPPWTATRCAPPTSPRRRRGCDVIGESAAGRGFAGAVGPGEAVRIFTGAPMPDGADAIVIQEDASAAGDARRRVREPADAGPLRPPRRPRLHGTATSCSKPGQRLDAAPPRARRRDGPRARCRVRAQAARRDPGHRRRTRAPGRGRRPRPDRRLQHLRRRRRWSSSAGGERDRSRHRARHASRRWSARIERARERPAPTCW